MSKLKEKIDDFNEVLESINKTIPKLRFFIVQIVAISWGLYIMITKKDLATGLVLIVSGGAGIIYKENNKQK